MKKTTLYITLLLPLLGICQIPAYYSGINFNEDAQTLKTDLANLITTTHTTDLPYTASSLDTWDAIELTDENPDNSNEVLLFYGYDNTDGSTLTDYSRDKSLACHSNSCTGLWTREHVYAKSIATPALVTSSAGSGTDVHNLRACDATANSTRNNRLYTDDTGNAHIVGDYWYPGDEWKGDVARIIMYMYLRYPTQCLATNIGVGTTTNNADMPDIFLEWNEEDPVSDYEIQRNTVLESIQGNRNPFIDNPYLATLLWGGTAAEDTWGTLETVTVTTATFSIYPTRVTDKVYITNTTHQQIDAAVYSITGQRINVTVVNNEYVNVSSLSAGIFILKITDTNYNTQTFKFVKQ